MKPTPLFQDAVLPFRRRTIVYVCNELAFAASRKTDAAEQLVSSSSL
jgi:hypothetical protein